MGDTCIILLSGNDTAGTLPPDMHVPPGGGPPPHRHDFEETFTLLAGELEVTFRGAKQTVRAGETIHVPAKAPPDACLFEPFLSVMQSRVEAPPDTNAMRKV